jgi:hypothetical protein
MNVRRQFDLTKPLVEASFSVITQPWFGGKFGKKKPLAPGRDKVPSISPVDLKKGTEL